MMDTSERGALMLVRFTAAAIIGWSVLDVALYVLLCKHNGVPIKPVPCLGKCVYFIIGVVMLVKAKAIAAWLSEKLDL